MNPLFVVLCDEYPNTIHLTEEDAIKASNDSPCPGPDVIQFTWNDALNCYEWDKTVYGYSREMGKYIKKC